MTDYKYSLMNNLSGAYFFIRTLVPIPIRIQKEVT